MVFRRKELIIDSGGPGKYRGGLGQRIEVEVRTGEPFIVASLSDRVLYPAEGYERGHAGGPGRFSTSVGDVESAKLSTKLPVDARYTLELPGGGGFYDPADRDPVAVVEDVAEGLVSAEAAERIYGVDPLTFTTTRK